MKDDSIFFFFKEFIDVKALLVGVCLGILCGAIIGMWIFNLINNL